MDTQWDFSRIDQLGLPIREGPRPHLSTDPPYLQLDQLPAHAMTERLVHHGLSLANVRSRESRFSDATSIALQLQDEDCLGPKYAFIDDHEFCYIRQPPEAGIVVTLPNPLRTLLSDRLWCEPHPLTLIGVVPETVTIVYAPRDFNELGIVIAILDSSHRYAMGQLLP